MDSFASQMVPRRTSSNDEQQQRRKLPVVCESPNHPALLQGSITSLLSLCRKRKKKQQQQQRGFLASPSLSLPEVSVSPSLSPTRRRSLGRKVHFDDNTTIINATSSSCQNGSEHTYNPSVAWYSIKEFREFRALHMEEAKRIVHSKTRGHELLSQMYEACLAMPKNKNKRNTPASNNSNQIWEEEGDVSALVTLANQLQKFWNTDQCSSSCSTATTTTTTTTTTVIGAGMERFASKEIYRDRKFRRDELMEAVGSIQYNFRHTNNSNIAPTTTITTAPCDDGSNSNNNNNGENKTTTRSNNNSITSSTKNKEDLLRKVCEEISRPSVLFARHLAMATINRSEDDNTFLCCAFEPRFLPLLSSATATSTLSTPTTTTTPRHTTTTTTPNRTSSCNRGRSSDAHSRNNNNNNVVIKENQRLTYTPRWKRGATTRTTHSTTLLTKFNNKKKKKKQALAQNLVSEEAARNLLLPIIDK